MSSDKQPIRVSMRLKIILAFFLFSSAVSVTLAYASYRILYDQLFTELQGRVKNIAYLGASNLNANDLRELFGRVEQASEDRVAAEEAENSAEYRRISDQLNAIRNSEERLIRYVYLLRKESDNTALYVVDADFLEDRKQQDAAQDELSSFASELDMSEYPVMQQAFADRSNMVEKEFTFDSDFNVRSVSAYAPVYGPDGVMLGLLGIDMVDADMQAALANVTQLSVILTASAIAVALLTSILLGAYFTRGILALERIVRRFGERDFGVRARVESSDEVGQLSFSFNSMAETISSYNDRLQGLLDSYGKFVPHDLLKLLGRASITEVRMGDQVRSEMSVLFSDIRDFTTLSELMTPEENFNFLNSYLRRVGPLIRNQGGIIDKYIGDAVMALFPRQADDAVHAAIAMVREVRSYNVQRQRAGYQPLKIGVGIHTGALMLGTVGEEQRMDTTVISDAVNLASRMEGLTKYYGVNILVSEETIEALQVRGDFSFRFVDQVQVKGKRDDVKIYEILDAEPDSAVARRRALMPDYLEAVKLYRRGQFKEAAERFEAIIARDFDPVSEIYLRRALQWREVPPPQDWRPIELLDHK
ncbi:MAG: HAMP domain-containing protein [Leptospirales bacterium]|nr:HAMP domain-containing protein [Leptospirales bacterium]